MIPEIIGWAGAFFYIGAYLLLTLGKLKANDRSYHFLNMLGAVSLIINALHFSDAPNIVTNLVWLGIALYAIITLSGQRTV